MITSRKPQRVAVASDEDWRPSWRVTLIPSYKAHRVAEPVPPPLAPQMPVIHEFLDAIGIDFSGVPEYEAEDVIASWTRMATGTVEIVSGDRDLFALIEDPRVSVLYPEKGGLIAIDEAEVTRRYGIPGRTYSDFAVLRGDPSDGLPGLKGVGAVSAAQLIRKHGGVAGLIRDGHLPDAQLDYLAKAMQVVRPQAGLAVGLPPGRRDSYPADADQLAALVATHGLQSSSDRLVEALAGAGIKRRYTRSDAPADARRTPQR